jgi:subtilisin family serine protease
MKKLSIAAMAIAAIFAGCAKESNREPAYPSGTVANKDITAGQGENQDFIPGEVLIQFKEGTTLSGVTQALSVIGGNVKEHIVTKAMKNAGRSDGIYLVKVPAGVVVALDKIKNLQDVEVAEPNYIYTHILPFDDSNDPYYSGASYSQDNLWGMMGDYTTPYTNHYASRAGEAWSGAVGVNTYDATKQQTGSSSVYVAVVDEGLDYNHPDLAANIWTNAAEAAGAPNVDDDGNGYVDDVHGYDFYNNDGSVYDAGNDSHGTHVAGTIGAIGNNGIGVAGVNWNVTIISSKFLGPNGGSTDGAIKALDYVTTLKTDKGLNIVATNNSWGGGGKSSLLQNAIERANAANILFVAAAGNSNMNTDRRANYPSCYPNANIISVASITVAGARSGFSNYGAKTVDLGAPGSYIWSTTPNNTYSKYSGTSMATPHVTGAVALYASVNVGSTAAQIKSAILKSARPTRSLQGLCVTGGRLDAMSAWQNKDNSGLAAD